MKKIISVPLDSLWSKLLSAISTQCTGISCFKLIRKGKVLFEYQSDEKFRPIKSITKTVIGMLVGIALKQHNSRSTEKPITLDSPLSDILTKEEINLLKGPANIPNFTLKQLLTMTPGLSWNEQDKPYGPENDIANLHQPNQNPLSYLASKELIKEEIGHFRYNGGLTLLLSRCIEALSGEPTNTFAERVLFKPMGIAHHWTIQPSGWISYSGGLEMSIDSLGKIGQLIANKGQFDHEQLVPQEWMETMFHPHVSQEGLMGKGGFGSFAGFGFHAWRADVTTEDGESIPIWTATGTGGQKIYALPDHDNVMVMQSSNFDSEMTNLTPDQKKTLNSQGSRLLKTIVLPMLFPNLKFKPIQGLDAPSAEEISEIRQKMKR